VRLASHDANAKWQMDFTSEQAHFEAALRVKSSAADPTSAPPQTVAGNTSNI